jgi:WD40 repeat protein
MSEQKYWAFISYSHQDEAWATWLHRALETYRVPRRLVGRETEAGAVPRRLFPVFRDRDELPSSHELGAVINRALDGSRNLIVVCSPRSATSKWVNEEIKAFRALGRSHRVFCLIVDGEPHASANPEHAFAECFAPALRGDAGFEPIAADARPRKDGRDGAKLKLIAGLLGLGLDELKQREKQRQFWQRVQRGVAAVVVAGVLAGTWQWFSAQREAREREILVERLVENGRLELLDGRQARAATYLNEALSLGHDTVPVRFMLGQAIRVVNAQTGPRVRHGGGHVRHAAFSPDGRQFVLIVNVDGRAVGKVYDAATGAELAQLHDVPAYPRILQFLPDGTRLLVSGFGQSDQVTRTELAPATGLWKIGQAAPLFRIDGGTGRTGVPLDAQRAHLVVAPATGGLEIWDAAGARKVRHFAADRAFTAATYSRDGRLLATADASGTLEIWDPDRAAPLGSFLGFEGQAIPGIQFTPDGSRLIAFSQFGDIRVWDVATRRQVLAFAGDPSWIGSIQFSADGRRFLTIGGEGYKVWSAARGVLLFNQPLTSAWFAQAALSPDGNFLYTADGNSPLAEVWAVRSRTRLHTLDLHTGSATAVALDRPGVRLLLASLDGTAEVWSTAMNPLHGAELIGEVPYSVAFVPGSDEFVVAGGNVQQGRALLLSPEGAVLKSFEGHPAFARSAAIDPSGQRLATGAYDGSGFLWDLREGARIGAINEPHGELHRAEFSPDGQRLATASYGDWIGARAAGALRDGTTGAVIGTLTHERPIYRLVFSPDGRRLATASEDGTIKLWDSATGRPVFTLEGHRGGVHSARFDAGGERIVSAGQDNSVRIWDAASGKALEVLEDPGIGWAIDAAFSPDGKTVAVGTHEGNILLWSPGEAGYRVLKGHTADVVAVEYLHGGRLLITQGWDGTIRAWDPSAGLEVARVAAPGGVVNSMDVSQDGELLVAGSSTYYLGVWGIALEARPYTDIAADLACRSVWALKAGALVPRGEAPGCPQSGK